MLFGWIKNKFRLVKAKRLWRKRNSHNETSLANLFDQECVSVGDYSYGSLNVLTEKKENKLKIGNLCSIANGVKFILSSEHPTDFISTFPFKVKMLKEKHEAQSKGDIIIDDDVWIATNAIILSGVHIGQGAIIGAGAVVTKDVPPYSVVGGIPAKIIKYRFEEQIIEKLLKVDFSKIDKKFVEKNLNLFYSKILDSTDLSWLPIKDS